MMDNKNNITVNIIVIRIIKISHKLEFYAIVAELVELVVVSLDDSASLARESSVASCVSSLTARHHRIVRIAEEV